jgi:chemotaxis protein histidine kinase CheA
VYCIYINPYPYNGSWAHFPSKILKSNPQTLKTQYGAVADKIFDSENDYSRLFYRQWDDAVAAAVIEKTQKKKGRKRKNNKGGKKTTKKLKTKDENDAAAANKKKQKEEAAAVKKLEKEAAKKKREEAAAAKKAEKEIAAELKRIQKEMAKLEKEAADAQRKLDKQANQLANKQRIRELSEQIFDAIHSNSAEFKMNSKYMIKDYYNNTVQKRLQNWEEITNKIRENPTFINYSICSIGQYIELSDMLIYVSCEKQQNIDIIMLENSNTSDANELVEYISSTNTLIDSSRLQVSNNFYKYTATTGDDNDMNINFSDDDNILIDDNLIPYINATYFIADYPTHDADNNNISTSSNEKLEKYVLFKGLFMEIYKLKDIVVARNQEDAEKIWNYFNNNNNNEQIRRTVLTFSGYVKYSNGIMRIRNHFE